MEGLKMKYFVLNPHGDSVYAKASRKAMLAYADCIKELNPTFADDLNEWVKKEE